MKHLDISNRDAVMLMNQAREAQAGGHLEAAFDFYSQTINVLLQINGPMHQDVASCISKMANIQFKFGDYL